MGFDSEGRLLNLIAKDTSFRYPILIEAAEESPTHQKELKHYLIRWLTLGNRTTDQNLAEATLDELIQRCIDLQNEWKSRPGCFPTVGRFLDRLMSR